MMILLNVDAEDLSAVGFSAMAWVIGLPLSRSDDRKVRRLAEQIESVLAQLIDDATGKPITLKAGWWQSDTGSPVPQVADE